MLDEDQVPKSPPSSSAGKSTSDSASISTTATSPSTTPPRPLETKLPKSDSAFTFVTPKKGQSVYASSVEANARMEATVSRAAGAQAKLQEELHQMRLEVAKLQAENRVLQQVKTTKSIKALPKKYVVHYLI